jgi:hypothetical protein
VGSEEGALLTVGTYEGDTDGEIERSLLKLGTGEDVGPKEGALLKLGLLEGDDEVESKVTMMDLNWATLMARSKA